MPNLSRSSHLCNVFHQPDYDVAEIYPLRGNCDPLGRFWNHPVRNIAETNPLRRNCNIPSVVAGVPPGGMSQKPVLCAGIAITRWSATSIRKPSSRRNQSSAQELQSLFTVQLTQPTVTSRFSSSSFFRCLRPINRQYAFIRNLLLHNTVERCLSFDEQ